MAGPDAQLRRPRSTTCANFGARPRLHLKGPQRRRRRWARTGATRRPCGVRGPDSRSRGGPRPPLPTRLRRARGRGSVSSAGRSSRGCPSAPHLPEAPCFYTRSGGGAGWPNFPPRGDGPPAAGEGFSGGCRPEGGFMRAPGSPHRLCHRDARDIAAF